MAAAGDRALTRLIEAGGLAELGRRALADPAFARDQLAVGYEHPDRVSDETIKRYLEPIFSSPDRIRLMERWFSANDPGQTVAIEPALRRLTVPTLVVWGTGDIFFDVRWAYWLRDTIQARVRVIEVPGGRLFFPEERPDELARPLRELWEANDA